MDDCKIYIGSHARFARVEPVCEYSIRKHATGPVEITFLRPDVFGYADSGCTGFTNMRYVIPHLTSGYAIYIDVDMLLLSDIAELLKYKRPGKWACLEDGANEVIVMDCSVSIPEQTIRTAKKWTLAGLIPWEPCISMAWNVTDRLEPGAKLIHFTDLKAQPWFFEHPNKAASDLWFKYESDSARRTGVY